MAYNGNIKVNERNKMRMDEITITWENKMKIITNPQGFFTREDAEKYALKHEPEYGRCIAIERKIYTI